MSDYQQLAALRRDNDGNDNNNDNITFDTEEEFNNWQLNRQLNK